METSNVIDEKLNILEAVYIDDSIESFQYIEKDTDQGTGSLNNQTELTVTFQNQDAWVCPGKSYLIIEGVIQNLAGVNHVDAVGAAGIGGTGLSFVNNGLMFLFSNCKYFLGTQQIEYFENAGITTTIHNLLTKPKTYSGLDWMWQPDNWVETATNTNSGFGFRHKITNPIVDNWRFSGIIPLSSIFNYCNDSKKVVYGMQHKISLVRTVNTRALIRNAAAAGAAGIFPALTAVDADKSINITKLRWAMPYVKPSITAQLGLTEIINNKIPVPLTFLNKRSDFITVPQSTSFNWKLQLTGGIERPRYLVFGFQTGRGANQTTNSASFDLNRANNELNVTSAYVILNGERYPYTDMGTTYNATSNSYSKWYYNYKEFFNKYNSDKETDPCLDYIDFINCYPLYVFDVSNQSERLKNSTIDTTLQMTFAANTPANTVAYCVMYFDSLYTLTGDNNKQIIQMI